MHINRIDHIVITVKSMEKTVRFYEHVLGYKHTVFSDRTALSFVRKSEIQVRRTIFAELLAKSVLLRCAFNRGTTACRSLRCVI